MMQVGNRATTSGSQVFTTSEAKLTVAPTLSSEIIRAHVAIDSAWKSAAALADRLSPISNPGENKITPGEEVPKLPTLVDEARSLANQIESLAAHLDSLRASIAL